MDNRLAVIYNALLYINDPAQRATLEREREREPRIRCAWTKSRQLSFARRGARFG
jgi:hypothetical protein